MKPKIEHKFGAIIIEREKFEEALPELQYLFSKFFPFRCEHLYHNDTFIYHGYSPEFDLLKDGEKLPVYEVEGKAVNGKTEIKFNRVEGK